MLGVGLTGWSRRLQHSKPWQPDDVANATAMHRGLTGGERWGVGAKRWRKHRVMSTRHSTSVNGAECKQLINPILVNQATKASGRFTEHDEHSLFACSIINFLACHCADLQV